MSRTVRTALVALALCLASPLIPWGALLLSGRVPDGLRVAAEPIEPGRDVREQLEARATRWEREEVAVDGGDAIRTPTRAALGTRVDVEAMLHRVRAYGRSGNPFTDLPALFAAWSGDVDLAWTIETDEDAVRSFVDDVAHQIDHPPQPARISERGRLLELSADGARLDREASTRDLLEALAAGRRSVRLPVERIPSGVGDDALPPLVPQPTAPVLVARYSTDYGTSGGERPRAHNVELAASFLDGARIPANGRLSFNTRVGERSVGRGYRIAHVILDGEMVDGLGGGVCQVASTLHAAAFLAGLDVVEHRPHSRPSAYIPMGLDATVVWPDVDLVLANPYPFPLDVRARGVDGQMVVELWGARRTATVEWHRQTLATEGWSDRYVEDATVPPGRERITQRPIRGFTILRERTIHDAGGVRIENRRLLYPPTDRIIRVAPGTLDPDTGAPIASTIPANPF
ncbi:MAG: VanW family protein [Sandaracinaceae bacterium]|nr:VanW family protein [Sandaracinaceae bacterium]